MTTTDSPTHVSLRSARPRSQSLPPATLNPMLEELATIVRCPISSATVRPARPDELTTINTRAAQQKLFHHDGTPVQPPIDSALITTDARYLYLIKEGIAFLMPGSAIDLHQD